MQNIVYLPSFLLLPSRTRVPRFHYFLIQAAQVHSEVRFPSPKQPLNTSECRPSSKVLDVKSEVDRYPNLVYITESDFRVPHSCIGQQLLLLLLSFSTTNLGYGPWWPKLHRANRKESRDSNSLWSIKKTRIRSSLQICRADPTPGTCVASQFPKAHPTLLHYLLHRPGVLVDQ